MFFSYILGQKALKVAYVLGKTITFALSFQRCNEKEKIMIHRHLLTELRLWSEKKNRKPPEMPVSCSFNFIILPIFCPFT